MNKPSSFLIRPFFGILFLILTCISCTSAQKEDCFAENKNRMCGLNFTAPPDPFPNNPMKAVQAINAEWIAVLPYGYTKLGGNTVRYDIDWQWWGERKEGTKETIRLAKESGLKVMLKPQVYIHQGWVGQLDFSKESDWETWEATYRAFILDFMEIAIALEVEMLCIGTEFEIGVRKREAFWRSLIQEVRGKYKGKIVYAANWDGFEKVPFWDALDMVGINSYFPLVNEKTPSIKSLKKAWARPLEQIDKFYCKVQKPIFFPEFGYLAVDGCAYNTWDLEKKINSLNINEQAQANAYQAIFEVFSQQEWWNGGFLWKWLPNNAGGEGYNSKDYTPQHKLAEKTVQEWFEKLK